MPFRNYTKFDPETLRVMTAAYDAALVKLGLTAADPRTSKLAVAIVELANQGHRDVSELVDGALRKLA